MSNNDEKKDVVLGLSNCGSKLYYPIKWRYNEEIKFMEPYFDKPINLYEKIQASKASVDITTIVQRATLGDLTVLHIGEKPYGDISNIPDNLNDLNAFNKEAINDFIKLDPTIRALFDNDVAKFAKAVEDGSYITTINNSLKPKEVKEKEEGAE